MKSQAAFADVPFGKRRETGVVDGAEGFGTAAGADSDGGVAGGVLSRAEEAAERGRIEAGHIAGKQQAPVREAGREGGVEAAERSQAPVALFQAGQAEMPVQDAWADEEGPAGGGGGDAGGPGGEGLAGVLEQGLVAAHAAAESAGEDEGRASHERIVAAVVRPARSARKDTENSDCVPNMRLYNVVNIMLVFCFACAGAAAASPEQGGGAEVRAVTTVRADSRTGRLVRVTEFRTAGGRRVPAAQAVRPLVEDAARRHAMDPELLDAVIGAESGYDPAAVSVKGAAGLMQLMPATARRLGARNRFDPAENLEAGVKLLKHLQEKYGDDRLALAAYNAGEGAVRKHGGVPPYRETLDYVRKIEAAYRKRRPSDGTGRAELRLEEREPVRSLLVETDAEGRLFLRTR